MSLALWVAVPAAAASCLIIYKELKDYFERQNVQRTFISFTAKRNNCIPCLLSGKSICRIGNCNFNKYERVCSVIRAAKKRIDLCVPICTINEDRLPFIDARKNGIAVRIIFDKLLTQEASNAGTMRTCLEKAGCLIRTGNSFQTMHHKFIIIDNSVLIVCSQSWTVAGFFANYENIEITNDKDQVKAFSDEFQYMWDLFG